MKESFTNFHLATAVVSREREKKITYISLPYEISPRADWKAASRMKRGRKRERAQID